MKHAHCDYVGWDVGGAHLKAARIRDGVLCAVVQEPCALWRGIETLDEAWRRSVAVLSPDAEHAVTMTGEMADCFVNRREGVATILAATTRYLKKPFKVYAGAAGFVDSAEAASCAARIASANWHATAACLGELLGAGVLLDVGSTTTDVVPFSPTGIRCADNDRERLQAGELVYTGVVRTPVMALSDVVRLGGQSLPLVAELFATSADIYRVLGILPGRADLYPTCDGADKTPEASARRLARMFGCDDDDAHDWTPHARALAEYQMTRIENALHRVLRDHRVTEGAPLVGAGVGRFLVPELARRVGHPHVDFADLFAVADTADAQLVGDCASAVGLVSLMHDGSPVH